MGKIKSKKLYKDPNRFFEFWLSTLAKDARKTSVKLASTYSKALNSLRKYPIKLSSGKECQVLKGFGTAICNILDERLKDFAQKQSLSLSEALTFGNSLTLDELARKCLLKPNVERKAHSSLAKKVSSTANLTSNGQDAHPISHSSKSSSNPHQIIPEPAPFDPIAHPPDEVSVASSDKNNEPVDHLPKNSYEIILLIDVRETFNKVKFDEIARTFGAKWEISSLPVGDFVWLARELGGSSTPKEVILGIVAERKRADDLASSIVDGRFVEQKARMQKLGFRKLYIFEECKNMYNLRISHDTLLQAMINSELVDGCEFVTCSNTDQCIIYLTSLTNFLTSKSKKHDLAIYSGGCRPKDDPHNMEGLWGVLRTEYIELGKKSPALPLREQFGLHLLQVHSITGVKAKAIVSAFPTPKNLFEAYDRLLSEDQKKNMLVERVTSTNCKSINKKASEIIYHLYNTL